MAEENEEDILALVKVFSWRHLIVVPDDKSTGVKRSEQKIT